MVIYIITGAFILLDMITGLIKAFKNKEYNSSIMREGLFHKAGSILVIVFGALVDYAQGYMDIGISIPVALSLCIYIVMMEIGSIIENVCLINPQILPDKLKSYFHKLVDKTESQEAQKIEAKKDDENDNVHSTKG